jgi:hypothetical protein
MTSMPMSVKIAGVFVELVPWYILTKTLQLAGFFFL